MKGSKNQRKPVTKPMGRGKKRNKKASDGKIKSSSALEYLMQRESQITNMLKGLEKEEKDRETVGSGTRRPRSRTRLPPIRSLKVLKGSSLIGPFVLHLICEK